MLRSSTSDFDTHRHTLGAGLVVTLWLASVATVVSQMLRSALDDRRDLILASGRAVLSPLR